MKRLVKEQTGCGKTIGLLKNCGQTMERLLTNYGKIAERLQKDSEKTADGY